MRKSVSVILAVVLFAALVAPRVSRAAELTDAKSVIDAIEKTLESVKDYTMLVYAKLPNGEWVFDYRCERPADIRTQIVDGLYRGAIIVSQPKVKANMVKIKVGNQMAWRLSKKMKLNDTPIVESVLDKFSTDLNAYDFTLKPHQQVAVEVGKVIPPPPPDKKADSDFGDNELREKLPDTPPPNIPHEVVKKDCYVLKGQKGDVKEELAVDTSSLWPVSIKRWRGGKLEFEAQIWKMEVNSGVHIDF